MLCTSHFDLGCAHSGPFTICLSCNGLIAALFIRTVAANRILPWNLCSTQQILPL